MTPTDLAQAQLDAYNAHDIDAFVACYHPDVEICDFPSGEPTLRGTAAMKERYGPLFERGTLHAKVVSRVAKGQIVIDEERVTGLRDGEEVHAVAIYEVEDSTIRRVWFVR